MGEHSGQSSTEGRGSIPLWAILKKMKGKNMARINLS